VSVIAPSRARANPNLLGPSGLIYTPTAYPAGGIGYYSLSGNKITKANMVFIGGMLEGGVVYNKLIENYSFNLKMPLLLEDDYLPQLSLGVYNYKNKAVETTNYIVLSKHITSFGVTLHAGYKRTGGLKDAAGLFNYQTLQSAVDDYKNDAGKTFFGVEYAFMPMFSIMGERYQNSVNAGLRFRPTPLLSIDYDFLDVQNKKKYKDNQVINFNFSLGF
jgi:hypothetical protein